MSSYERKIKELFEKAGVEVNGPRPFDIQVHNKDLYKRILTGGMLAVGESYMDGWWDVKDLPTLAGKVMRADLHKQVRSIGFVLLVLKAHLFNRQSVRRAFQVGEEHYDAGNDLYERMLDKRMTYTCAYWREARTLDEAQEAKLDLVCRKIGLKAGDRVLDIGGGWGSLAGFAAEKYGAEVVAITVSKEQARLGREKTKGLPVEIRVQDYRDVDDGPYDHIVSIGMFEHVGYKNYRTYMQKVRELLKEEGLFLLHTIGTTRTAHVSDPWFDKYIFPNGMLPSVAQIGPSIENLFVMEDWHNFGYDYSLTLREWFKNFDAAWPDLKRSYNERFYRMWKYYLLTMVGSFESRTTNQLWQIVLSPRGVDGGYTSAR